MGFLSGVLSNIHKHLGQHKNEITSAIDSLNTNKHAGKNGFNAAIVKVVEGVRGYNGNVKTSNDLVKRAIKNLQRGMKNYTKEELETKLPNKIDPVKRMTSTQESADKAKSLVAECRKLAKEFINACDIKTKADATKNAIKDLNPKLRETIANVRKNMQHESKRLKELSSKESKDLEATETKIAETLSNLKVSVDCRIDAQMKELIKKLSERVQKILKELKSMEENLLGYVKELYTWLEYARKLINEADKEVHIILKQVNEPALGETNDKKKIEEKVQEIGDRLDTRIVELTKWKKAGDAAVKQAKDKCTQIGEMVETESASDGEIYKLAEEMQDKAENLRKAAKEVKDEIGKWVGKATGKVTELERAVKEDLKKVKENITDGIWQYVNGLKRALVAGMAVADEMWVQKADKGVKALHEAVTSTLRNELGTFGINVTNALLIGTGTEDEFGANVERALHWLNKASLNMQASQPSKDLLETIKKEIIDEINRKVESQLPDVESGSLDVKLEKLTRYEKTDLHGNKTGKKKELQSAISTIQTNVNQKLRDNSDVKNTIERGNESFVTPFSKITTKLNQIAGLVGSEKQTRKSSDTKTGITNYLDDLEHMLKNGDPYKLTSDVKNTQPSVQGVEKIKSELQKLHTQVPQVTNLLMQLCSTVGNNAYYAKRSLTQLKDEYFSKSTDVQNSITKIYSQLDELHNEIKVGPIHDAEEFLQFAKKAEAHFADELKKEVDKDIKDAVIQLTSHARWQYVDSIKHLLTAFADKVEKELAPLPGEVERDLQIGFKGLMSNLDDGLKNSIIPRISEKDVTYAAYSFYSFFTTLKNYTDSEIQRVHKEENEKKNLNPQKEETFYTDKLKDVYATINALFSHIQQQNKYDRKVPRLLDDLEAAVSTLKPLSFEKSNTPILDSIGRGLGRLVDVMRKAYISPYDGQTITWNGQKQDEISRDGNNCAKVFLSCVTRYVDELHHVFYHGGTTWKEHFVSGTDTGDQNTNMLRDYLTIHGYGIESLKTTYTGKEVAFRLSRGFTRHKTFNKDPNELNSVGECFEYFKERGGILAKLFTYLHHYYEVCHYSTLSSIKQPSSVYQMLLWLSGFPYNPVYQPLSFNGFSDLFEKEEKNAADSEGDEILLETDDADTLPAHPENITASKISDMLTEVCHQAHDVLTSILGHGHADGIYAVDFNTNTQGFSYPSRYGQCIDMLVDILCRLYQQLYFLYCQCCNDESCSGWRGCLYGNAIGGSDWKCNSKQCADQKCNQKVNQTCELHPKCGVKSPLQSYLEDGLPGFLPHSIKKPGCKLECTISNHRGIPCQTPMGFNEISVMASHTKNGEHLWKVLDKFCGKQDSPLTKLCGYFMCIMQQPPQSLGDVFAYYYSYLANWTGNYYGVKSNLMHTQQAYSDAVTEAYFGNRYESLAPSALCSNSAHKATHSDGNLLSITNCHSVSHKPCGLYVQPLTLNTYSYYSSKHKTNHLSWIVYITETFYDLLKKLYEDCCGTCKKPGSRCYDKCCTGGCKVKAAYAAIESNSEDNDAEKLDKDHNRDCKSIVQCRNTHPNLYKFGFTFGNPLGLSGIANNTATQRTCKDFCEALKLMLGKESVLIQLRKQIDDFLWAIRLNFSITVLALWLLSLLYLIHIMVIRLDLLHIKSHLHSPSSHRIAAQSLLAAARVNKLNRLFYLQP